MLFARKKIRFLQRTTTGPEVRDGRIIRVNRDSTGRPSVFVVRLNVVKPNRCTSQVEEVHRDQVNHPLVGCGVYYRGRLISV